MMIWCVSWYLVIVWLRFKFLTYHIRRICGYVYVHRSSCFVRSWIPWRLLPGFLLQVESTAVADAHLMIGQDPQLDEILALYFSAKVHFSLKHLDPRRYVHIYIYTYRLYIIYLEFWCYWDLLALGNTKMVRTFCISIAYIPGTGPWNSLEALGLHHQDLLPSKIDNWNEERWIWETHCFFLAEKWSMLQWSKLGVVYMYIFFTSFFQIHQ